MRRLRRAATSTAGATRARSPPPSSCATSATRATPHGRRCASSARSSRAILAPRSREYGFVDEWDVAAPREAVFAAIADARSYPEWWRPVYIEVEADGEPALGQGVAPALQGPPALPPAHALADRAARAAARDRGRRRRRPARARALDADRDARRRHARPLRLARARRPRAAARPDAGPAPRLPLEPRWAIARAVEGLEPYARARGLALGRSAPLGSADARQATGPPRRWQDRRRRPLEPAADAVGDRAGDRLLHAARLRGRLRAAPSRRARLPRGHRRAPRRRRAVGVVGAGDRHGPCARRRLRRGAAVPADRLGRARRPAHRLRLLRHHGAAPDARQARAVDDVLRPELPALHPQEGRADRRRPRSGSTAPSRPSRSGACSRTPRTRTC